MNSTDKKMKNMFEQAKKIALFGHIKPDGDCIGSMLGFGSLLEKQGKQVGYFTPTLPSRMYDFLPGIQKITTEFDFQKDYDILVFLDFGESNRIELFYDKDQQYFQDHSIIVIDHHIVSQSNKKWFIKSDPEAMSTCEIIFETTYPRWPELYDNQIATYFYLGLTTDSGNFRYDEDHQRILKNALKLVQLGADKKLIVNNAFRKKSFDSVKMMERLFKRLQKKEDFIYTWYTQKDLKKFGLDSDEASIGQNIIQDIWEAKVTAIFRDKNHIFSCSLRSKDFDVQPIAKYFGGGGHMHAAGFILPRIGSFSKQIEEVSTLIKKLL